MPTKAIHEANLAEVNELSETSAEFVIRPLYHGYGNTLGNSLRRVLLSSIKGAAITAFSIEGSNHEFSTIPGIREDVVDIMLNLKNIRFKSHSDEPVEATLEIKGSAQTATDSDGVPCVIAKDIKLPADLELGNPNQIICHVDDPSATLKMRFIVESGRGYMTVEEAGANRTYTDMIAIDAVFSPVLRVRYNVADTRVGQDTNLQQLTLVVDTDGTISPRAAFEEAAAILVNQYKALAGSTVVESAPLPGTPVEEDLSGYNVPIEELGFSARTANALTNNGIKNLSQLIGLSEAQLKELKGFGSKALEEVQEKITEYKK